MKKFIIGIVACLPMLAAAWVESTEINKDFGYVRYQTHLTFINTTDENVQITQISGACASWVDTVETILIVPHGHFTVPMFSIETTGDSESLCNRRKPKQLIFRVSRGQVFRVNAELGINAPFTNLTTLHSTDLKFEYTRRGSQNIITVSSVE